MGVGTFFTNDFVRNAQPNREDDDGEGDPPASGQETSKPMNMQVLRRPRLTKLTIVRSVIKLYKINDIPCVKISDEVNKVRCMLVLANEYSCAFAQVMGEKDAVEMVKHR